MDRREAGGPVDSEDIDSRAAQLPFETLDPAWLGAAIESIGHAVMLTDADGRIVHVNAAFESLTGYERDEVVGEPAAVLNSGVHDEAYFAEFWATITGGHTWEREIINRRKDGTKYIAQLFVTPMSDAETDTVTHFMAMQLDLTERRQTETALSRMERLMRRTESVADVGGWELDVERGRLRWTPGTYALHGVSQEYEPSLEEAIGFYHPDDRDRVRKAVDRAVEWRVPYDIEARIITASGVTRLVHTTGSFSDDEQGTYLRGTIRDVTDEVTQRQRLMVFNRVLRHNLRNSLNVVLGNVAEVRGHLIGEAERDGEKASSETARRLDEMVAMAEELLEVSDRVRQFEQLYEDIGFHHEIPVESLLNGLARRAERGSPVATVHVEAIPARVLCNRPALRTCLVELLRNALEHTPQPETPITLFAEEGTGGRLRVGVADGGEGIPAMDRRVLKDRIEEPLSHMRGLGLWTVAWLTEAMGGSVEVDDGDDGTTVALVFPASKWERTD